jgi:hypothetical protein
LEIITSNVNNKNINDIITAEETSAACLFLSQCNLKSLVRLKMKEIINEEKIII